MSKFKYNLGEKVSLHLSGEVGTVDGRAEYVTSEPRYYIVYKAADGRQLSDWHDEAHLIKVDE